MKPFGPVQLYVAPATVDAVKFNVDPSHNAPLFETVGTPGSAFITTVVEVELLVQPLDEVVTEYVPACNKVIFVTVGF